MELNICPHCKKALNEIGKTELEELRQNGLRAHEELENYCRAQGKPWEQKYYWPIIALVSVAVMFFLPDTPFPLMVKMLLGTTLVIILGWYLQKRIHERKRRQEEDFSFKNPELWKALEDWDAHMLAVAGFTA